MLCLRASGRAPRAPLQKQSQHTARQQTLRQTAALATRRRARDWRRGSDLAMLRAQRGQRACFARLALLVFALRRARQAGGRVVLGARRALREAERAARAASLTLLLLVVLVLLILAAAPRQAHAGASQRSLQRVQPAQVLRHRQQHGGGGGGNQQRGGARAPLLARDARGGPWRRRLHGRRRAARGCAARLSRVSPPHGKPARRRRGARE